MQFEKKQEGYNQEPTIIRTIEWDMMDKWKFIPYNLTGSFTMTACVYPLSLVNTRLQVQKGHENYGGTFDAFFKIAKYEGFRGFYKGFFVSCLGLLSGLCYIVTYENTRQFLKGKGITDSASKALLSGGTAALVGQTIGTPVVVITQCLMLIDQKKGMNNSIERPIGFLEIQTCRKNMVEVTAEICKKIFEKDGLQGFFRGYKAALSTSIPAGALWWFCYHSYQELLDKVLPNQYPMLVEHCLAAVMSGVTSTTLMNPMDVVRARLQVQRLDSVAATLSTLWTEEKMRMFVKGLSAKLISSCLVSTMSILGYETIKRLSVRDEYKESVRW